MEQHPVPQNVTTFQFRLIGDMTLKQFGYLAGGAILAYICYKLPLPLFLNWPLAIVAALGGFGFAFVPIEERPMDVWVLSFFKSVYSPTQYVWTKNAPAPPPATPTLPPAATVTPPVAVAPPVAPQPVTRRGDILSTIFTPVASGGAEVAEQVQPVKSSGPFDWFFALLTPKPTGVPAHAPSTPAPQNKFYSNLPAPQPRVTQPTAATMDFAPPPVVRGREAAIAETAKKENEVVEKLDDLKRKLEAKPDMDPQVAELQKQMAELRTERDKMEAEIARLRLQSMPPPAPAKSTGTYVATPASRQGPSVRIITQDRAVKVGLPRLTTFPNVVTGIVKDGDQNLLPGVLVTVKDKAGVPVRALKTNRLGQFAASTQLTNGTYFVEVEDPRLRYTFDRAQITLNGSIVPALEIFAKSQKEITRARLEKELFGDNK